MANSSQDGEDDTSTIMKMNVFEYFGCNLGGVRVEVLKRAPNRP